MKQGIINLVGVFVEVMELWTVFHEHYPLLGKSSNMEFFEYLDYLSSYTHFIVSIIPRL